MFLPILNYKLQEYRKSNKWIFPMLMFICYLGMAYTFPPYYIHSSYALSATVAYFLMVWSGYSVHDSSNPVIEQIIFLKAQKKVYSYLSKVVVVVIIAIIYSFIGTVFPLVVLRDQTAAYGREVLMADIIVSFLVHTIFSIAGGMIGLIFSSISFVNQKLIFLLTPIYALLGLIGGAIVAKLPVLRVILWLCPPLEPVIEVMNQNEYMTGALLLFPLGVMSVYLLCQGIIYIAIIKNKSLG